ncbi:class I adenylate-forming enzyme family protein [Streptomyces lushanensis]|uniref:class I adenylate-forming enzyme family protein n=1 Tax=Streptomyces lushanensis TaxID=1434255 RepID=UPI00082E97AD|nr:class I adenylate-forming enzyme family protein [Streptomyces lushanensis]
MFRQKLLTSLTGGTDRPAVVDDLGPVSYNSLDLWSDRIATVLSDRDEALEEVRTALLLPNSAAWLAGYLGALKSGAVVAPLNAALTRAEIAKVLTGAGPRHLLTAPERADEMTALCQELRLRTRVHALDPAARSGLPPAPAGPGPRLPAARNRAPQDPCLIMHTSGSTGACKGVVQSEQSLHLATGIWHRRHRLPEDVVAVPLPMAHTYGHLAAVSTLLAGATLVVSASCGPEQWARLLQSHGATVVEAVPTLYARMLRTPLLRQHSTPALPQLRRCISGGQAAPQALRTQWQQRTGVALLQSWGMTELSGAGLCAAEDLPRCLDSVGPPVPGLEVKVMDPTDQEREIPRGQEGELWVRGPQVAIGYRNSSRRLQPTADREGWLHTGDLATRDAHGCVRIVGRSKDAIMTGGYTIQPGEVEEALRSHSAVRDVAVLGRPDPDRGEVPHALVVLDSPRAPSSEELIEHCRTLLARYKVPRTIDFVDHLPLSPVGKLDRPALRRTFADSAEQTG